MFDTILAYLDLTRRFIARSSADPRATSLTIKFGFLALIPYIMQAAGLACDFGQICYDIQPTLLEQFGDALAIVVFYALSVVSASGILYGLTRKIYRTATGQNKALE